MTHRGIDFELVRDGQYGRHCADTSKLLKEVDMSEILIPCTRSEWKAELSEAKAMDRECVERHGQRDRDQHLCGVQRAQFNRGYLLAEISTNIHGYCARDTHNDGLGNMSGNGSAEWALDWARRWQAEAPQSREVVVGYIDKARMFEFASARAPASTSS